MHKVVVSNAGELSEMEYKDRKQDEEESKVFFLKKSLQKRPLCLIAKLFVYFLFQGFLIIFFKKLKNWAGRSDCPFEDI